MSSVKDSVTSGLATQRLLGEVVGSNGQPVVPNMEATKFYLVVQDREEEKVALAANKSEEKRNLQMDPIIETLR